MSEEGKEGEGKPPETPQYLTKAEMETMLTAQQAQFTAMITRAMETLAPKPVVTPAGGNDGKVVNFYDNPKAAAEALFDAKMAPMRDQYISNEKTRQLTEALSLPFATDYADEIKKVIDSAPAEFQASPGFAREAYNLVIGRHRDDVFKKMKEAEAKKPEFTETTTAGAPAAKKSETLSATEREAANGMGLSDDEYKKWRDNPDAMAAAAMAPQKKAS